MALGMTHGTLDGSSIELVISGGTPVIRRVLALGMVRQNGPIISCLDVSDGGSWLTIRPGLQR